MAMKVLVFVLVLLVLSYCTKASKRNLSEIRYHFTTCGATGRSGPSLSRCRQYYREIDSIVTTEGRLFGFGEDFTGSQGFSVPRTTVYNITIAGAAGGRGVCNFLTGQGVALLFQAFLMDSHELLISVGQRGVSPCDGNPNRSVCTDPPLELGDLAECNKNWLNFISQTFSTDVLYAIDGGGGGGGSSVVHPRIRDSSFTTPLAIAAGGGGTSAILDYSFLLDANFAPFLRNRIERYQFFINGDPNLDPENAFAPGRGFRNGGIFGPIAGAGGGLLAFPVSDNVDGNSITTAESEDYALGGFDCTRGRRERLPFPDSFGGFGGGGGGCGGGGGGGGFHGGDVLGAFNNIPGGGGISETLNGLVNRDTLTFDFNDGDGFVDIVPADCNCIHQCVVFEDEFECLCPTNTQLAPDQSDCFEAVKMNVTQVFEPASIADGVVIVTAFQLSQPALMYSMEARLNTIPLKTSGEVVSCAMAFFGSNETMLVTTKPIRRDTAIVRKLARVTNNGPALQYSEFLNSPFEVTGAALLSTGECSIESMSILMNISTGPGYADGEFSMEQFHNIVEYLNATNVTETVLKLEKGTATFPPSPMQNGPTSGLVAGTTTLVIIVLIVAILVIFILITIWKVHINKSGNKHATSCSMTSSGGSQACNIYSNGLAENTSTLSVAYHRYQSNEDVRILHTGSNEVSEEHTYETLDFSPEEVCSTVKFSPRFGVSAPIHNFSTFNKNRPSTSKLQWNYPRSKLIYIRELGEGNFGKVLLMKAQGIAGYTGKIPVAVKTLTSREPDVVKAFTEEMELMMKFSHPNIVSLLGICWHESDEGDDGGDSAPLMILEYMQHGDLQSFLQTHRMVLNDDMLRKFAIEIAEVMEYLSLSKYVHRDLAARNCLVGPSLQVKIADFGLARGVHDKDYYRVAGQAVLPVRWMAPECLLYGIFTTASDVWSYGVVLWEIMSYGATPLEDTETQAIIQKSQDGTLHHSKPNNCPGDLYYVMCQSHKHAVDQRPTFTAILEMLSHPQDLELETH